MVKLFFVLCLLTIILSCKQKKTQTKVITNLIKVDSITADYEEVTIVQNKGFAKGMTAFKMVAQKGKALHFIKKVLAAEWGGLGNKDVVDIYFDDDSSYYKVDYYPYSGSDYQRPTTLHLFFFPRTKKMFFFHYGDTLVTSKLQYDTLKFKYQPTLKK